MVLPMDSELKQSSSAAESESLSKSIYHALAGRATLQLGVTAVV
jgi:hypothetical protein